MTFLLRIQNMEIRERDAQTICGMEFQSSAAAAPAHTTVIAKVGLLYMTVARSLESWSFQLFVLSIVERRFTISECGWTENIVDLKFH